MQWTEEELDELGITGLGQDAKPFDEVFRNINDFLPSSSDYELLDNCANTYAQLASEWVGQIDEIMRETTMRRCRATMSRTAHERFRCITRLGRRPCC
jgi:hypothetical protein